MTFTVTHADGGQSRVSIWRAEGPPRGRLVVAHGIRSHCGWYPRSCAAFAAAGYEVCFVDRRGSGVDASSETRGDAPGFRTLCQDFAQAARVTRPGTDPQGPTTFVGISWGAKIALATALREPGIAQQLLLITPGFCPRIHPTLGQRLQILCNRFIRPRAYFPIPLNEPELFTRDPAWQAFLRDHPGDLHAATARFFVASAMLDRFCRRQKQRWKGPTLVWLAGDDAVIDNAATRKYLSGWTQAEIRECPGLAHTLEFEDANLDFVQESIRWLNHQPKRPRM
jgi:alpha-beta hydrolase superfamily lysophospholipase